MRRTLVHNLLILALLTFSVACKSRKAIVKAPEVSQANPVVADKKEENVKLLRSKNISFNTLSLKGKADIDMNGNNNTVTVNVRILRDQKIWMSVTALLGIEVARAVITPDSIMVINRLQSTYIRKPFSYVYRYASRQVTFKMLQDVITGNTINTLFNPDARLELNADGLWTLTGNEGNLAFNVLFNTFQKSAQVNLNDARAAQALKVVYGNYQKVNEYLFPTAIKINSMSGTRRVDLDFDFSKVESNVPLDFPFTVPKRFELIN